MCNDVIVSFLKPSINGAKIITNLTSDFNDTFCIPLEYLKILKFSVEMCHSPHSSFIKQNLVSKAHYHISSWLYKLFVAFLSLLCKSKYEIGNCNLKIGNCNFCPSLKKYLFDAEFRKVQRPRSIFFQFVKRKYIMKKMISLTTLTVFDLFSDMLSIFLFAGRSCYNNHEQIP